MGNRIASSFVSSLRRSLSGQTVVSRTSANPPAFVDPLDLPGVARAYVCFDGCAQPGAPCGIYNKSTTIQGVSANDVGDYTIEFMPNVFTNKNYIVTGSVEVDSTIPVNAANTFFVKGSGVSGLVPTTRKLRIQTINTSLTGGFRPAYARKVHVLVYK